MRQIPGRYSSCVSKRQTRFSGIREILRWKRYELRNEGDDPFPKIRSTLMPIELRP